MPEGRYYIPTQKRPTRRGGSGPRPGVWVSGPDELRHEQHIAYLRHRAQANYRKETHLLTFDQWCDFWNQEDYWLRRGRRADAWVLTRIDHLGPWSQENCHVIQRYDSLHEHNSLRRGMKYQKRDML